MWTTAVITSHCTKLYITLRRLKQFSQTPAFWKTAMHSAHPDFQEIQTTQVYNSVITKPLLLPKQHIPALTNTSTRKLQLFFFFLLNYNVVTLGPQILRSFSDPLLIIVHIKISPKKEKIHLQTSRKPG